MASLASTCRTTARRTARAVRTLATSSTASTSSLDAPPPTTPTPTPTPPTSHYKITLTRSAISLGHQPKATLEAMGLHRRFQTVYHPHGPEIAGKILRVKELVQVENVCEDEVRTREEMRRERRASRGYVVVGSRAEGFMNVW